MWAYIFFFIHLDDTKPNDYTALDLYVSSLVCDSLYPCKYLLPVYFSTSNNEVRNTLSTAVLMAMSFHSAMVTIEFHFNAFRD